MTTAIGAVIVSGFKRKLCRMSALAPSGAGARGGTRFEPQEPAAMGMDAGRTETDQGGVCAGRLATRDEDILGVEYECAGYDAQALVGGLEEDVALATFAVRAVPTLGVREQRDGALAYDDIAAHVDAAPRFEEEATPIGDNRQAGTKDDVVVGLQGQRGPGVQQVDQGGDRDQQFATRIGAEADVAGEGRADTGVDDVEAPGTSDAVHARDRAAHQRALATEQGDAPAAE